MLSETLNCEMEQAVGYARISEKDQSRHSLPGQVADIATYCKKNNLELVRQFVENGQSAFNFSRKEWKELEALVKSNKSIKYLVIYAMDRFSRANLGDALQKMDEIQKRLNVKILTVTDPVDLDIDDFGVDLRRVMELMLSNYELKKIKKRTSDGMYQAMASGKWAGRAPYGYLNARDEHGKPIIAIDDNKAFIIRMVFRQYLAGMEMEEIRKLSAANGMKLKGNSSIRRILSNPLYAGLIQLPKRGSTPASLVRAIHAPIVSESDFWRVQTKLNGKTRVSQRKEDVYLTGLIQCPCGLKMTSDKSRGKSGKQYRYYVCKKHRKANSAITMHAQMDEIMNLLNLPEKSAKSIAAKYKVLIDEKLNNKGGDLMKANLNLKKIKDKIDSVQEKFLLQPDIDERTYRKVMADLRADEQRMQMQVAELSQTGKDYYNVMNDLLPMLTRVNELFLKWPTYKQQAFLKLVFGSNLYYKDKIYRTPYIHPLFSHNLLVLKEKKLLLVEQPDDFGSITPVSSPYGIRTRITTVKGWCPSP